MTDELVRRPGSFVEPNGSTRCSHEGRCNLLAVWHVLWALEADCTVGVTSPLCAIHHTEAVNRYRIDDVHQFGPVCNMPGTVWRFSQPETPGCCHTPESSVDDQLAELAAYDQLIKVPEPVGAAPTACHPAHYVAVHTLPERSA